MLARTEYVEKLGTGIKRIRDAMHDAKLPAPAFDFNEYSFYVNLEDGQKEDGGLNDTLSSTLNEGLNERQKKAVEFIAKRGKITTKEYISLTETSLITAKRDLVELKRKRIIKFVGAAKTGYYILNDTVNDTVKG